MFLADIESLLYEVVSFHVNVLNCVFGKACRLCRDSGPGLWSMDCSFQVDAVASPVPSAALSQKANAHIHSCLYYLGSVLPPLFVSQLFMFLHT